MTTHPTPQLRGLSLWFIPTGTLYKELAGVITDLSQKYGTPVFEPHITLLGQLEGSKDEILAKAKSLASRIKPFRVQLRGADFQADYFRCLYVEVERSDEIAAAHQTALRVFGLPSEKGYWPHLSIMYGNVPAKQKEKMLPHIVLPEKRSFEVRRLQVFSTTGNPLERVPVKGFDLAVH